MTEQHEPEQALKPRQKAFLRAYLDPESHAYGNATEAAVVAGYTDNRAAAAVQGNRLLNNVKIQTEVARHFQEQEAGIEVRLGKLHEVASGEYTWTTRSTVSYPNGTSVESVREHSASAGDVARANDVLNRFSGIYDHNRAEAGMRRDIANMSDATVEELRRYQKLLEGAVEAETEAEDSN